MKSTRSIFLFLILISTTTLVAQQQIIENKEAVEWFKKAMEYQMFGKVDFPKAMACYNTADSIEPNNPIILHERGLYKFNMHEEITGAFDDINRSIDIAKDPKSLEIYHLNRGLCYMEMLDIERACIDFNLAGKAGQHYIREDCGGKFNPKIQENPDSAVVINLSVAHPQVYIRSTHNPARSSACIGRIQVENRDHSTFKINDGNFNYGLEDDETVIYLEAIDSTGKKFHFFTDAEYNSFSNDPDLFLKKGEGVGFENDLTFVHQFPYPGIYKVRIALRPCANTSGLKETYFSNWVELSVQFGLEPQEEGY